MSLDLLGLLAAVVPFVRDLIVLLGTMLPQTHQTRITFEARYQSRRLRIFVRYATKHHIR